MRILTVRIAEHIVLFRIHAASAIDFMQTKFWNLRLEEQNSAPHDLEVDIFSDYGQAFVDYNVEVRTDQDLTIYTRADYRIEAEPGYKAARLFVYDDFALKHALINLYSAFITCRDWGLLIHSSCIVEKGKAYLFAGPSGAGKSTVTLLSSPRRILSDEAAIAKIGDDGIVIYNSPFRSDTETPDFEQSYPLAAVQLLRQSRDNRRLRAGKMEGLLELLNRVFYWAHSPEETKKVLRLCKRLVEQVPVYELYFQKNNTFWEEIS